MDFESSPEFIAIKNDDVLTIRHIYNNNPYSVVNNLGLCVRFESYKSMDFISDRGIVYIKSIICYAMEMSKFDVFKRYMLLYFSKTGDFLNLTENDLSYVSKKDQIKFRSFLMCFTKFSWVIDVT